MGPMVHSLPIVVQLRAFPSNDSCVSVFRIVGAVVYHNSFVFLGNTSLHGVLPARKGCADVIIRRSQSCFSRVRGVRLECSCVSAVAW